MIRAAPDSSRPSSAACTFSTVSFSKPIIADSMTFAVLFRLFWLEATIMFWLTSSG